MRAIILAPDLGRMNVGETSLSPNPRIGWVRKPDVADRNNFGFRDDDWFTRESADAYQIVLLADCIGEDSLEWNGSYRLAYPYLLKGKLRNLGYNVIVYNMSVGGYNTLQEVELFKSIQGETGLKPDRVLLGYCLSDKKYVAANVREALFEKQGDEGVALSFMAGDLLMYSELYRYLFVYYSREINKAILISRNFSILS